MTSTRGQPPRVEVTGASPRVLKTQKRVSGSSRGHAKLQRKEKTKGVLSLESTRGGILLLDCAKAYFQLEEPRLEGVLSLES